MVVSNWKQKRKYALDRLRRFLVIWQGPDPSERLEIVGLQANDAVLALELPNLDLPLPYDEEKMPAPGSIAATLSVRQGQSSDSGDDISENIRAWIHAIEKFDTKTIEDKKATLDDLKNPIKCTDVAVIVHKRSDNIARSLKSRRYPVILLGNKYYCNAEHAALVWPKWKKYWKEKQEEKN